MMCSTRVLLHDRATHCYYVMLLCVMSTDVNLCSDVLYPNVYMMCYIVTTHPITYPHIFVLHRLWNTII